ncbi:MAG: NAD(P)-dependent methylenetetrahydromethanopterin dehydrogenase [Acetobacteraceae bacterium]
MAYRHILHMLSPLKHMSPFDSNMAVDAGYDVVLPYTGVALDEVAGLVQDAIFSRGPKGAKATGLFLSGKSAELALDMLEAAKAAMVPPFECSVFADPAGSFTTAAAMVAKAERHLVATHGVALAGRRTLVFGGTGVVGFAAGVIAAGEGAEVTLIGHDGITRVARLAQTAQRRFGVHLAAADGSSADQKTTLLAEAAVVFAAGRAGVQILDAQQIGSARSLLIAADVNAVPPAGIAGIGVMDDGVAIGGGTALGIGALAIGVIKSRVQGALFRRMIEADRPLYLDFRDAFRLARELLA